MNLFLSFRNKKAEEMAPDLNINVDQKDSSDY